LTTGPSKAFADLREAVQVSSRSSYGPAGMAWLLATSPETKVRDGRKALEYATQSCERSGWKDYWCLQRKRLKLYEEGKPCRDE
jgi:hypothetical protein